METHVTAIYMGPLEDYDAAIASARFGLYAELTSHDKTTLLVRVTRVSDMKGGMPRGRHFGITARDAAGNVFDFVVHLAHNDRPARIEQVEPIETSTHS